jgi:hypothetical protein
MQDFAPLKTHFLNAQKPHCPTYFKQAPITRRNPLSTLQKSLKHHGCDMPAKSKCVTHGIMNLFKLCLAQG